MSLENLDAQPVILVRSVIPAKAGIQAALLWIPAFAGMTVVGKDCREVSPTRSYLRGGALSSNVGGNRAGPGLASADPGVMPRDRRGCAQPPGGYGIPEAGPPRDPQPLLLSGPGADAKLDAAGFPRTGPLGILHVGSSGTVTV